MALQNRIDPWGKLNASDARGHWLGNRGILHNEQQKIIRTHTHKAWVTCQLHFKNRKRQIFAPNSYSELFFLDEATAFAAGHRPCAECRRERFNEFKQHWIAANGENPATAKLPIGEIDRQLHTERINKSGSKVSYLAIANDLPDGTLFAYNHQAFLIWNRFYYVWLFEGYTKSAFDSINEQVEVLTPRSVVNTFKAGLKPEVHHSIQQLNET